MQVADKSPSSMEVYKVEAAYTVKPFNATLIFHILFFFFNFRRQPVCICLTWEWLLTVKENLSSKPGTWLRLLGDKKIYYSISRPFHSFLLRFRLWFTKDPNHCYSQYGIMVYLAAIRSPENNLYFQGVELAPRV